MGKDVIELPSIYIGVDPYPVRTPTWRPSSPHDFPGFGIPGHAWKAWSIQIASLSCILRRVM
ncbi:hypothetical protein D3C76_1546600 [compost metagenome]